jgi:hypothetical protein
MVLKYNVNIRRCTFSKYFQFVSGHGYCASFRLSALDISAKFVQQITNSNEPANL